MAKRVLTVACRIPGDFGEYVDFRSRTSLLDADFVLFRPTLGFWNHLVDTRNTPLPGTHSEDFQRTLIHWRTEISAAMNAGNTVFVLLSDIKRLILNPEHILDSIGSESRRTATNYDTLPYPVKVVGSTGTSMSLSQDQSLLREYWDHFGSEVNIEFIWLRQNISALLSPHDVATGSLGPSVAPRKTEEL